MLKKNQDVLILSVGFASVVIGFLMISDHSLWIDEGTSALLAGQPKFIDLINEFSSLDSSEVQMPFYVISLWFFEKVFGSSEYALRSLNIIYYLLLLFSSTRFISPKHTLLFMLIVITSPFIWYNMNEARSTMAIMSCAMLTWVSLSRLTKNIHRTDVVLFCLGICLGTMHNMLFLFVLPSTLLFIILEFSKGQMSFVWRSFRVEIAVTVGILAVCVFYYLNTLIGGSGGIRETPGITNLVFALYEFLGFSGIGPPRNQLRQEAFVEGRFVFPLIITSVVFLAGLAYLLLILIKLKLYDKNFRNIILSIGLGLILFLIASYLFNFRFWGRHLVFLYPPLVILIVFLIERTVDVKSIGKLIAALYFICMIYSIWNLRFDQTYQKDNYKLAIKTLIEEHRSNETARVFVSGYQPTCMYYGIEFEGVSKRAEFPKFWGSKIKARSPRYYSEEDIRHMFRKDDLLLLFNKDMFDPEGLLESYLIRNNSDTLFAHHDFIIVNL